MTNEKLPPKKTIKEILTKLKVNEKQIQKLTPQIQQTKFFDTYTKYEEETKDIIKLTGKHIYTQEENYLYINFKESTLEVHEILNKINRIRKYTSGGIDLSKINQL